MNFGYLVVYLIGLGICFLSGVIFESRKFTGLVVFLVGLAITISSSGRI